jgi:cell division protein FtsW (lipid II flippase)
MQKLVLILDLFGTILIGIGALEKSQVTWEDVDRTSKKSKYINRLAWIGVGLVAIGFLIQLNAIW